MTLFCLYIKTKTRMIKYNITVFINDGSELVLPVQYESDYNLRKDVTSIGINGSLQKVEGENSYLYFPPHKIEKIEVEEVKL